MENIDNVHICKKNKFITEGLNRILNKKLFHSRLYLGSMFYADFGNKVLQPYRSRLTGKEKEIEFGEVVLSVRICFYQFCRNKKILITSDDDLEEVQSLLNSLLGKCIVKAKLTRKNLILTFEEGTQLLCDLTNKYDKELERDKEYLNDPMIIITFTAEQKEYYITGNKKFFSEDLSRKEKMKLMQITQ